MGGDRKDHKTLSDPSRRSFMKNAGLAGVTLGAAAVLGSTHNQARAATGVKGGSVYESILGEDSGRIYAKKASCPGPIGPIAFEEREISSGEIVSTETYDIVVIGAGITGIIAALKAADMGRSVLVLEKMDVGRGCFESYAAIGSDVLNTARGAGFFDDSYKIDFKDKLFAAAQYRIRPDAVQTFMTRSGEAANFMEAMFGKGNAGLTSVPTPYPGAEHECQFAAPFMTGTVPSGRQGMYVVRELAYVGRTRPEYSSLFEIRYNTPAVQLIREEDGPVTGVIAKKDDQYLLFNANKGVILATGGYDANPSLMEAWCRSEDYASASWWNPCWGTTGDGHMMGLMAGATMDPAPHTVMNFNMGRASGYSGMGAWFLMTYHGGIMVNQDGKRFVNETLGNSYDMVSNAMNAQPDYGKDIWTIVSNPQTHPYLQIPVENFLPRPIDIQNGWGVEASSVQELAEKCGIDATELQNTIDKCNSYSPGSTEPEFGRVLIDMLTGMPASLGVAPSSKYYALKARSNLLATTSGLLIDANCNVLDTNNKPIEGLYAGGNVSGGMFSGNYPRHMSGMSIGRAITFGFVAAEHASSR